MAADPAQPPTSEERRAQLRKELAEAGDRRDWNEADRIEKELERLNGLVKFSGSALATGAVPFAYEARSDRQIPTTLDPIKFQHVANAVYTILKELGVAERPDCKDTPYRVARMWLEELSQGVHCDPQAILNREFEGTGVDELVAVHDIPFYSTCAHHLLPFHGKAHVGYIPAGRIVGLSKIARLVDSLARQPHVQEQLTNDIADALQTVLKPRGVIVILEARHLCMEMRGIRTAGALTTTSALRGVMLDTSRGARQEFLSLLRDRR
jgi:GTP cyclohydrolase I